MVVRHQVTPVEANDALDDPHALTLRPDPASQTGRSIRVIGWATSTARLLTLILVEYDGITYGATGWPSSRADRMRYANRKADR